MTETTDSGVASVQAILDRVAFDSKGLMPAIIQEEGTKDVLMLGYMDNEAIRRTLTEGRVTFWSRSRQEYWRKGDTSGNRQYVRGAALDCDGGRPARHGSARSDRRATRALTPASTSTRSIP